MKTNSVVALSLALIVMTFPIQAEITSLNNQSVGRVQLSAVDTQNNDFVIAVFSNSLVFDPVLEKYTLFPPKSDTSPVSSCLSVANIKLHSGRLFLQKPGTLTFRCHDVPDEAQVYGWINGTWEEMPSERAQNGHIKAPFHHLTTYAVFLDTPSNHTSREGQI